MTATRRIDQLSDDERHRFLADEKRLKGNGDSLRSPFFTIEPGIITNADGSMYDRPLIREKPSVMVVVWGIDANKELRFGLIRQKRPPSNDPLQDGDGHPPVTFAQVPMGYLDGDTVKVAALKEMTEELGPSFVVDTILPSFARWNIEPNTYATWHNVAFVQLDLSSVDEHHTAPGEMITSVAFLRAAEVLENIARGRDETGAYYRGGSTLAPLMMFFAAHPEHFPS